MARNAIRSVVWLETLGMCKRRGLRWFTVAGAASIFVPRRILAKCFLASRKQASGVDGAGEAEHGVFGRVVARVVPPEHRPIEARQLIERAGDGEPEWVSPVHQLPHQVVGVDLPALVVEVFEDLFADDAALDLDGGKARLLAPLRRISPSRGPATRGEG